MPLQEKCYIADVHERQCGFCKEVGAGVHYT